MSETIETIEIAKAIKAGLDAAFASADPVYPVYASGVPTDIDGNIDEAATEAQRKLPCVVITMRDCMPMGYRSVMRQYPGRIRAVTHFGDDQFQVALHTLTRAVSAWLASGPTLSLTLRKADSVYVESAPENGIDDQFQYSEWAITVHTGPATA